MEPDAVAVKPLAGYALWVQFADGKSGTISMNGMLEGPVFQPLKDKALFDQVFIHPELRVITWPNGADLSPEFAYRTVI